MGLCQRSPCLFGLLALFRALYSVEVPVKLIDGRDGSEGSVYVKHGSEWGLVCDDFWDLNAGNVVCRQLGYSGVASVTHYNHFRSQWHYGIFLDDVKCTGLETNLGECEHRDWLQSNCHANEAGGVICNKAPSGERLSSGQFTAAIPSGQFRLPAAAEWPADVRRTTVSSGPEPMRFEGLASDQVQVLNRIELVGGRTKLQGYVRAFLNNGESGVICSDRWTLVAAQVVCRGLGKLNAEQAVTADVFGAKRENVILNEVFCHGNERHITECTYRRSSSDGVQCSKPGNVAGVVCTAGDLPDLMPSIAVLQPSAYIQDRSLYSLQCAMEERCLASSAYTEQARQTGSRRLLRFTSSIYNNGTADFKPHQHRSSWQWHDCHKHYHSMEAFTHYDVLDTHGNRVAEGHKASFCLEDVECTWPHRKRYSCRGFAEQGISVGCADVYKHDLDCQWIDITDLTVGVYKFKLMVNPDFIVPELSYDNNAAICELQYTGYSAKLSKCRLSRN